MNTLHSGDCLEVMPSIPSGSVDFVCCDLPYGSSQCPWDVIIPFDPLWKEYKRIVKPNGAIALNATQPFASLLVMSNFSWFRYEWIWGKNLGTGHLDAKRKPLRFHENVMIFYDKQPTYNPQKFQGKPNHGDNLVGKTGTGVYGDRNYTGAGQDKSGMKYPRTIINIDCLPHAKRIHRTQKPTELAAYLIRTYTNEGDTVLDNAMGSGTTGEACILTNRNFIGIEKDPDIFAMAAERLNG